MARIRVTFDLDLESGDYEVQYNNLGQPGQPIDLTRTLAVMRRVFIDHEAETDKDAALGITGQASIQR